MNFKLFVAVLALASIPMYVQAQAPNPPKSSKATKPPPNAPSVATTAAQKVVKTISGDKTKIQAYCDIGKLGGQIEEAERKQDLNRIDDLNKQIDQMATKLGPDYVALISKLDDIGPDSKEAQEISSALDGLDKLCAK
jgi:microsomal dipeptidase-like Zn-dependent dipeptidase